MSIPGLYNPETMNFLKRGICLEAGAGTIEKLFSGCLRIKYGGTQYYLKLKAMMIGAGSVSLQGAGPWTATVWMIGKLNALDVSAPTNWTFVSPSTNATLMSKDSGSNHVTIRDVDASQDYTPNVRGLSFGFNNFVFPIPQTGSVDWADVIPTRRGINVRYVLNSKDTNIIGIHNLRHIVNSTIVVKPSAGWSLTATGGKMSPIRLPFTMDTPLVEAHTHVALSGNLVTT